LRSKIKIFLTAVVVGTAVFPVIDKFFARRRRAKGEELSTLLGTLFPKDQEDWKNNRYN
jgi:hypothetical protein